MNSQLHVPSVGAPDPELLNSPVVEETDEEFEVLEQQVPEVGACYFNNVAYKSGQYVSSGSELLRCDNGAWLREGGADPDNP